MDSLSSVSPSIVLPHSSTPLLSRHVNTPLFTTLQRNRFLFPSLSAAGWRRWDTGGSRCKSVVGGDSGESDGGDAGEDVEVERALRLDGTIPGTSDEFVKQVSSRAYDMRRHLHESLDSSSYDVLETNPWRETSKPVYVLTQKENQLCTMKTRRSRSEVERELGLLFSKGRRRSSEFGNQTKQSKSGTKFQMHVEDVREGVLVFEDQNEAVKYCDILQGKGQGCEGVTEIEASSVFDLCRQSRALAVLFRRGRTPPQPENLKLNLKARKHSLED